MSIDRAVFAFAGAVILISLDLSQLHHPYWLWLTAFVGANMLQSAFTGFVLSQKFSWRSVCTQGRRSA